MEPRGRDAGRCYRSELREESARRTRQRVLDAAREVFLARGYAGTTVRALATGAGVSVPTVELLFGTKAGVLKAAIDVAIAGDDEPVPILDRDWAAGARGAQSVEALLTIAAGVLGPAQERSAGLVLAALEAAPTDAGLATLTAQLVGQRETTAGWLVDRLTDLAALRPELTRQDAVETVWLVIDPAVFVRLTQHRGWTRQRYQEWVTRSVRNLLLPDPRPPDPQPPDPKPRDQTRSRPTSSDRARPDRRT